MNNHISKRDIAQEYRSYIIEAADILKRKVDEIVEDINKEEVGDIYISLSLSIDSLPCLNIQKNYFPVTNWDAISNRR